MGVIHSTTLGLKESIFPPIFNMTQSYQPSILTANSDCCPTTNLWFLSQWEVAAHRAPDPAPCFLEPEQHLPAWHDCFVLHSMPRVGVLAASSPPL